MVKKSFAFLVGFGLLVLAPAAQAEGNKGEKSSLPTSSASLQTAGTEQLAAAIGHYAKSRSLLIAAIREFDKGYKLANPDALIDSKTYRNTLITRAEEMEHVLDPQPRASKGAVSIDPDSRLLSGS